MHFSPYSLIPNANVIAQEYDQKPLKTKYIPNLKRDLKQGWLMPYLYHIDAMLHGRWEYWHKLQLVPTDKYHLLQEPDPEVRLASIQEHILPKELIPPISFNENGGSNSDKGRKMLDICLAQMLTKGGYIDVTNRLEYLFDWMLYGFGHPHPWFKELPKEPHGCDGCGII